LLLTQEKLWNYLAHIADGGITDFRVVFELRDEPDQRTAELLRRADEQFRRLGGTMLTRRKPADR
jgi:hypothetical protein